MIIIKEHVSKGTCSFFLYKVLQTFIAGLLAFVSYDI